MGKQNAIKRGSGNKQSALKKLRSALSTAGITGANSQPSKRELKRRRRSGQQKDTDKIEIRRKKLQAIQSALNPFELQVNRKKLDILGLKRKDEVVNVAAARQKATERRKQTLGKERERKGRFGGIVDQRIGENDPTMDPEERMLRRFTVERQRKSERNTSLYNLEDDSDSDVEGGIASLTHFGQALGEMTDDFEPMAEDSGKMDIDPTEDSDPEEQQPARKKTKAEVMQEIIAKSKQHKHEQQQQREQDDGERQQLDDEFESVRGLLSFEDGPRDSDDDEPQQQRAYDAHVRELTFEMRARPQDRLLTEEEKARDELERLEKAERHRLRRMDGLPSDSEPESDADVLPRGRRGADRLPVADDLGDDFTTDAVDAAEDEDVGMLGAGLEGAGHSDEESDDEEDETSGGSDLSGDEESDDLSGDEEEDSADAKVPVGDTQRVAADRKPAGGDSELPYTFPAPTDYAAWIELVGGYTPEQQLVVVRRLRTQYHIRLSPQNKPRLGRLAVILVDHLAALADNQHLPASATVLDELSAHIGQLASVDPEQFGEHCRQAVIGMHRRILEDVRGNHNALKPSDCALMRLFVSVFSSSDRYHAVVTPMLVAIGQYLAQHVFLSLADVTAGLVLAAVVHESQRLSRRLVPEALNFLYAMLSAVVCDPADPADWSDGPYPLSRRQRDALALLRLRNNDTGEDEASVESVHWSWLSQHSCGHLSSAQQYGILKACLLLMRRFIDCYFALPAFVECFAPLSPLLTKISQRLPLHFRLQQQHSGGSAPTEIRTLLTSLQSHVEEMLSQSLAKREPLRLQYHRPLAIESVAPKFETSYNLDHHYDPDRNRNEIVKLRRQVARERRGAVRELRRDAQFIAGQRLDEQLAKDKLYSDKMKKAWSVLEADQSDLKKLDKLKIKERKAKVST
ncbi:Nop14-like protein [Coemansia reversa NRRL 1564]|uniref:Nop14-like protein n=1 Tax=Coemansia reversa (strain ATCC 12441 / NRRL 1564) TaxID=763665 RepID=A0A2G5BLA3_COERN|nr:Nop14-like protein [Coemansia reversa NRRL 1564]|eukprot:PIA19794.1 Nop14-like protein [Coemansia reversa NRRL 1564]